MTKDLVAIIKADSYDGIRETLQRGLSVIGGLPTFENSHIAIKPNLCAYRSSDSGATTDVDMVRALIEIINEKSGNSSISIVESNSESTNANRSFIFHNYSSLEHEFSNVKLMNLSRDNRINITLEDGKAFHLLEIPETLMDVDYLISLTKLKTHVDQRMSCALKNQFGLIPKKHKSVFHPFLSEVLCDVNNLFPPDLCIVDGIVGMEGFGPTDGPPKKAGIMIFGTNAIATDIVAAKVIGFKPKQVPYLKYVMKKSKYKEDNFEVISELSRLEVNFDFISLKLYLLGRMGLRLQRWSFYLSNFGELVQMGRSALGLIGYKTIAAKVSWKDRVRIARKMVFKFNG